MAITFVTSHLNAHACPCAKHHYNLRPWVGKFNEKWATRLADKINQVLYLTVQKKIVLFQIALN